ncbi:Mu homology domain (MHD) profile [Nakaseomyces glabratus]
MTKERTLYADRLLTTKTPFEATEVMRVRLSESKLVSKEFLELFAEVSKIKRSYVQKLNKIVSEKENLKSIIDKKIIQNNVYTSEELSKLDMDLLGNVVPLWDIVIKELRTEVKANKEFLDVIESQVLYEINDSIDTDNRWHQREKHAKLSKIAAMIEKNDPKDDIADASQRWDVESPYLFEMFERIDYNRLDVLKNSLLRYQTGYGDFLQQFSKGSEDSMTKLLEFSPDEELERFATEAINHKFNIKTEKSHDSPQKIENYKSSPQKDKRRSTFGNITHRFASHSSQNNLMNNEFSDSNNNATLSSKKSPNKLKSRVGSIFGRNKLKKKNTESTLNSAISEESDLGTSRSMSNNRRGSEISHGTPYSVSRGHERSRAHTESSRANPNKFHVEESPSKPPKPVSQSTEMHTPMASAAGKDVSPVRGVPLSASSPPLQPHPRSDSISRSGHQLGTINQGETSASNVSSPALPPSRKQINNSTANTVAGMHDSMMGVQQTQYSQQQNYAITQQQYQSAAIINPQITGELGELNPQETGSSTSLRGQSMFRHSTLDQAGAYGLNASVAEVINASFKDGVVADSQLVGEVALNYTAANPAQALPIGINLKVNNGSQFEKVILNQAFMERVNSEEFKVNPVFIASRTLGAIKYSISHVTPPVVVHPVWRFEPHQASVVLNVKMSPMLPDNVNQIVLNDFAVFISIDGANTTSALSKPQGSFNKEKNRISWRYTQPLVLNRDSDGERIIARFMTDQIAHESPNGVLVRFTTNPQLNSDIGSGMSIICQELDEENPFGADWKPIALKKTLATGKYSGLA